MASEIRVKNVLDVDFYVLVKLRFQLLSSQKMFQVSISFLSVATTFCYIFLFHLECFLFPPTSQCEVGSQVAMRVGGDFFFDPTPSDPSVDLLLVAGGVGINPLYSILLHAADLQHLNQSSGRVNYNIGSAHLCYSAKNTHELLFQVRACITLLRDQWEEF